MLNTFSCVCWPSVCFLWRNVYLGLLPIFFNQVGWLFLSCLSGLYILEIKPLLVASFASIFYSLGFILFIVSFAMQKLVSLIMSYLFILAFSIALGGWPKKTLLQFMSENAFPLFSSRNFMVSYLIFKSLSHSEFVFVYSVRDCSKFIDLYVDAQTFQYNLLKKLSFLHSGISFITVLN